MSKTLYTDHQRRLEIARIDQALDERYQILSTLVSSGEGDSVTAEQLRSAINIEKEKLAAVIKQDWENDKRLNRSITTLREARILLNNHELQTKEDS